MHRAFPALLLLFCVASCSAVQIVEFCPDPYLHDDADEYLVLNGTGSLEGIAVSDGKEGFRFPPGTSINGTLTIARDSAAFETTHGRLPDYEWYDVSPRVPDVISGDKLRMANARDRLMVYNNGVLVQTVSWPEDVRPREGQVHFLEAGRWDVRPLFLGQSRFSPATYENVTVTTFVSPDSSYDLFYSALASADRTVLLNVYEFTGPALARPLIDARGRGADVQVLLEGGPVGGISPQQDTVVQTLKAGGIPVHLMISTGGTKAPYRFDHAKYMVVDGRAVLVTSENFGRSGFPAPGMKGNRGWGVYIENMEVARYFEEVFLSDIRGAGEAPAGRDGGTREGESAIPYAKEFPAQTFSGATVTPVLAPDTAYLVDTMLEGAQETIDIEQAYITNESVTALNPYLATAINASRRGVRVRVLLDSYWYNVGDEADNDEMAALINRIAAAEHLPLEARTADLASNNLEKIHNKGIIVDDESVLVSSINWNTNSPNFNREAGVIIAHPGAARYYRQVFEDDWQPAGDGGFQRTGYLKIALLIALLVCLAALFLWKQRKGRGFYWR